MLIGHKYAIKELVKVCDRDLAGDLTLDNVLEALKAADVAGADYLQEKAAAFVAKNFQLIKTTQEWKDLTLSCDLLKSIMQLL